MFRFQREIALALLGSAGISWLALLYDAYRRNAEGKIRLDDGQRPPHDPFDVTTPEDLVDGDPIDEDTFWTRMRWRKVFLTTTLALTASLNAAAFGYALVDKDGDDLRIAVFQLAFSIYTTLLALRSAIHNSNTSSVTHSKAIVHLAGLTALAAILLFAVGILPYGPKGLASKHLQNLWYALIALYSVAATTAFTTPLGPPLHFPPEKLYPEKEVRAITNPDLENVVGTIGSSPWDILMFSYTTKVVAYSNRTETTTLEVGDLPILPADMRAPFNYSKMRSALKGAFNRVGANEGSRWWDLKAAWTRWTTPTPGSGWILVSRLLKLNRREITIEVLLAAMTAVLFYAPAYFLRALIAYFEQDPRRSGYVAPAATFGGPSFIGNASFTDNAYGFASTLGHGHKHRGEGQGWRWGLVYVVGLFGVNAIGFLIAGQLWSLATTIVQVRIRVQLNSVLFAKTLVRKDVASSAAPATKDKESKGQDKDKDRKKDDHRSVPILVAADADDHDHSDNDWEEVPQLGGDDSHPTSRASPVAAMEDDQPEEKVAEQEFGSKAQIMTLMTTDVDRVSEFAWHLFTLVDSPIEIVIGTSFLYTLLGPSCILGLTVILLFLPVNHLAGKTFVSAQEGLMKCRDERVGVVNEVLAGVKMVKFMAWERPFERRVLEVRERELGFQRMHFRIETLWNAIWSGSPILVTLVSFWHFAVVRGEVLTPSVAFTSIIVFNLMKYALTALPETFINMLQCFVSLRRIEKYLNGAEVQDVPPLPTSTNCHHGESVFSPREGSFGEDATGTIELKECTVTWPSTSSSPSSSPASLSRTASSSTLSTPTQTGKFSLQDLTLSFPPGALSLICGKLGSGKTLLLLALLGEADVTGGELRCPRSPPDALERFSKLDWSEGDGESWVVPGLCAYVPQTAWLRNASIRENILFNLPYNARRYAATLHACALTADLAILEDGDLSEIGERGVGLSGGQKARVSLARAVYSRASTLFLDDVLSAVDAHTAKHLYEECLMGELVKGEGRTVVLVSHHTQLCIAGAAYVVCLENGRLEYAGGKEGFLRMGGASVGGGSGDKGDDEEGDEKEKEILTEIEDQVLGAGGSSSTEIHPSASSKAIISSDETQTDRDSEILKSNKTAPRKVVEDETRAVGRIQKDVWAVYFQACGGPWFWVAFAVVFGVASCAPVLENSWLRHWSAVSLSSSSSSPASTHSPTYYIAVYAAITMLGVCVSTARWFVLFDGSIRASSVLYKKLLEAVLFADVRFHDTVSRGRLLNRFGKDFEGIDGSLAHNMGWTVVTTLSAITTLVTVSVIGGLPFVAIMMVLSVLYYNAAKVYGQTSRDMRRLDSVSRSPLYSIYGETISGVPVLRAFGASSKLLRDMLRCVDANSNPYYWLWGVNRWLSIRFNLLSAAILGAAGLACLVTPTISAPLAGFALAFASSVTNDLLFMVRRFVGLEQSMVALERVKEYSELRREPPEFIEPRPPVTWPSEGRIEVEGLTVRYAPELPDVLHDMSFTVRPGEKIGILGRTGSGKSTLALSFFRFVEPTQGRIVVDGLDLANIGLTDVRSRITIIPQDPTILSGTVRSTLDVFNEHEDADIYEALRRVHLLPTSIPDCASVSSAASSFDSTTVTNTNGNVNVFRNLDAPVSEGGENFSTGEKQLLCMARAILKRSKVLVMDEATASVDYATDELIGNTIRQEFAQSTILTIAHRLRTVIDYDRVMLLDQGRIIEFDTPSALLSDPDSKFRALCQATGKEEFAVLERMAGVAATI